MPQASPGPPEKKRGVRWNESNLAENEIVRAEIRQRCAKIDEPPTPYHHDDEDMTDSVGTTSEAGHANDADNSGGHTRQETLGALDASPGPAPGLKKRERDTMQGAHGAKDAIEVDEPSDEVDKPSDEVDKPSDEVDEASNEASNDQRQPVSPPTDPRRGRAAFDEAIVAEEKEGREQELARAEKKKAFEEARRRHYGNAGLGMRLGNLLGKNRADRNGDENGDENGDDEDDRDHDHEDDHDDHGVQPPDGTTAR